ncbi:MAG: sulfite exporter TauE/SafE family protein [Endomicrobiia bacterium]
MNISEYIKLFIAGITLGNGPCLFICLPIVLPYIVTSFKPQGKNNPSPFYGFNLILLFSFSRLFSYSILGFFSVSFYKFIQTTVVSTQNYLQLILGILIVFIGVFYLISEKISLANPVCSFIQKKFVNKNKLNMLLFGLLIGLSPCAPLLAILAYIAAMAKNSLTGLIAGFSFGLGTLITPLIPVSTFAGFITDNLKKNPVLFTLVRVLSAFLLIYFGFRLISDFLKFPRTL